MTDLRPFIEKTSELAEALFNPDGQMLAYVHAAHAGKTFLFVCPMGPEDEQPFRLGIPARLKSIGCERWCFFTEAWAAEYVVADGVQTLPRDRADRMELVTFCAEARDGTTLAASRQILRLPGAPAKLMPLVFAQRPPRYVMASS